MSRLGGAWAKPRVAGGIPRHRARRSLRGRKVRGAAAEPACDGAPLRRRPLGRLRRPPPLGRVQAELAAQALWERHILCHAHVLGSPVKLYNRKPPGTLACIPTCMHDFRDELWSGPSYTTAFTNHCILHPLFLQPPHTGASAPQENAQTRLACRRRFASGTPAAAARGSCRSLRARTMRAAPLASLLWGSGAPPPPQRRPGQRSGPGCAADGQPAGPPASAGAPALAPGATLPHGERGWTWAGVAALPAVGWASSGDDSITSSAGAPLAAGQAWAPADGPHVLPAGASALPPRVWSLGDALGHAAGAAAGASASLDARLPLPQSPSHCWRRCRSGTSCTCRAPMQSQGAAHREPKRVY